EDSPAAESTDPADPADPESAINCQNVCSVASTLGCAPFTSLAGSIACGFASIPLCNAACSSYGKPQNHCIHYDGNTACVTEARTWWCDSTVDTHRVYLQYEFVSGFNPNATGIQRTTYAPQKHCASVGFPVRNQIHRWQVCNSYRGCSAWYYPTGN